MFMIEELLKTAGRKGASDIHITVGLPPVLRINGRLKPTAFPQMLSSDTLELLIQIMNQEQRSEFEETGEADLSFSIEGLGRYRVNAFRQQGMAAMTIRLMDTVIPGAEELKLPKEITSLGMRKKGLVLLTGPAGCGKSTTMAALIDYINENRRAHVITLENPVEYIHVHKKSIVNQREIGRDTSSYVTGLNAALREDPDVIAVGEIKDGETLELAVTAAETGRLVFSSLYAQDTQSAVDHLIDLAPVHRRRQVCYELANALEAVTAQKLIPTVDGTGRAAVFEILYMDEKLRELIRSGETGEIPEMMKRRSIDGGALLMDDSVYTLYREGVIDWEQALLSANDPDRMEKRRNE